MGDVKDPIVQRHARAYAESMFQVEEHQADANASKQAIRNRMHQLAATSATAHGYMFTLTVAEESFHVKKVKRGSKPADTEAPPETAPLGTQHPTSEGPIEPSPQADGDGGEDHDNTGDDGL